MYIIYTMPNCGFCDKAKELLKSKELPFEERSISEPHHMEELQSLLPKVQKLPQIFHHIGGYNSLSDLLGAINYGDRGTSR